jgi:hypothetical protein
MSENKKPARVKGLRLFMLLILALSTLTSSVFAYRSYRRVRRQCWQSNMLSDGRGIGSAAQQYFLTNPGKTQVTFSYDPITGKDKGDLEPWLGRNLKHYVIGDLPIESGASHAFSMRQPDSFGGEKVWFSDEGKTTRDPSDTGQGFLDGFK